MLYVLANIKPVEKTSIRGMPEPEPADVGDEGTADESFSSVAISGITGSEVEP